MRNTKNYEHCSSMVSSILAPAPWCLAVCLVLCSGCASIGPVPSRREVIETPVMELRERYASLFAPRKYLWVYSMPSPRPLVRAWGRPTRKERLGDGLNSWWRWEFESPTGTRQIETMVFRSLFSLWRPKWQGHIYISNLEFDRKFRALRDLKDKKLITDAEFGKKFEDLQARYGMLSTTMLKIRELVKQRDAGLISEKVFRQKAGAVYRKAGLMK